MKRIALVTVTSLVVLGVVLWLIMPMLPDPVATHFGPSGGADGFSSPRSLWAMTLGLPVVLALLLGTLASTTQRSAPVGLGWIAGLPVGIVWGIGTLQIATLLPQRGLADAADATIPLWAIPLGLVLGVGATILAGRLANAPATPTTTAGAPSRAPRTDLPPGTVLWQGDTPASRITLVMGAVLVIAGIVLGAFTSWWMTALVVATAVPVVGATRYTVTVGPAALQVAGVVVGWPSIEVPVDTITGASVSEIRPLEFGGIGIRMQPGLKSTAVVTRRGPALEVTRTDDSTVKISLDDPDEAAGIVNTLLDRRAASARDGDGG